jgi:fumarate reductase subunit D
VLRIAVAVHVCNSSCPLVAVSRLVHALSTAALLVLLYRWLPLMCSMSHIEASSELLKSNATAKSTMHRPHVVLTVLVWHAIHRVFHASHGMLYVQHHVACYYVIYALP